MKKVIFMLFIICVSCNTKNKKPNLCVNNITYLSQKKMLIPSIIKIKIDGDDGKILKRIENNELKNVLLFSVKKEFRHFFIPINSFKKFEDPITISLVTGFFDANRSFEKKTDWNHIWTQKEIEAAINGDVGLVFINDTIIINHCKKLNKQE